MYGVAALLLLYWDKTERLGVMLGLLMVGMVTLFLIVVASMGLDWAKYEVAVSTAAGITLLSQSGWCGDLSPTSRPRRSTRPSLRIL